jgi:hypothetical protein
MGSVVMQRSPSFFCPGREQDVTCGGARYNELRVIHCHVKHTFQILAARAG